MEIHCPFKKTYEMSGDKVLIDTNIIVYVLS
jgi:hypothetical protein